MNPNNIQYGNPELKPALTDHFESKYDGQYQGSPDAQMKSGFDTGVELLYSVDLLDWCRLDIIPRYSYIHRGGTNIVPDIESSTGRWQIQATANIDLWENARLMINTIYIYEDL